MADWKFCWKIIDLDSKGDRKHECKLCSKFVV